MTYEFSTEPEGPTEFAEALYDSGFNFRRIAEKQYRMYERARVKAIGWAVVGLSALATTSEIYVDEHKLYYSVPAITFEAFAAGYSFVSSKQNIDLVRQLPAEIENSRQLVAIAQSARPSVGSTDVA